jgi:exodeoxyribonuclease V alpha subunit
VALAYTATVHKSQGSEYPAVVIPLSTQHYPMLERNLFYTGVTRGKQ